MYMYNDGLSPADVAVLSGNNGGGNSGFGNGDWSAWIIIFLIFATMGWGRNGFGGNNGGNDGYGFGWNIGEEESIRKVHFRGLTFEHINDTTIKCTVDKVDEEAEMIEIYIDINDSFHHGTSCITFNR